MISEVRVHGLKPDEPAFWDFALHRLAMDTLNAACADRLGLSELRRAVLVPSTISTMDVSTG